MKQQKHSFSGYHKNAQNKPVGPKMFTKIKYHIFKKIMIAKARMLHTSLICPFSVLACPTVIFLKKRSFVSTTGKKKEKARTLFPANVVINFTADVTSVKDKTHEL